MKPLLAAAFLIAAVQGILPPLVGPLIPDSNGTVTGLIRRADTGLAIPDVLVAVAGADESPERAIARAVSTDRNGRFTIRDVTPGTHIVVAQRDGFFSPFAQTSDPVQVGPTVEAFEGQISDIGALDLIPGGAMSGRISGPDGLPLALATVQVLRASYSRGRLTFIPVKSTLTDDLGEYRLFWLPPGHYYVRGQYRAMTGERSERYERIFFPGIADEDAAPSILVGAGAEVSGMDIIVSTAPVRGVTISGRVAASPEGESDRLVTAVYVVPRGRQVQLVDDGTETFSNQVADSSNGRFEIRNVPRGEYNLFPVSRDDSGKVRTARVAVDVEDRDIENVSAILDPPMNLRGRVTWDEQAPGDRLPKNAIVVRPLDEIPPFGEADTAITPNPETGEFVLPLPPGRYSLRLASALLPSNAYIADVKRGEESVLDAGFTLSPGSPEPLDVSMMSRGGIVSGTAIDPARQRPFAYATVALVPELSRRQNSGLYWNGKSAADGTFKFMGIPPGYYKLFAWSSVPSGAWENPAFLERFEDRGIAVSVSPGGESSAQVTVIR